MTSDEQSVEKAVVHNHNASGFCASDCPGRGDPRAYFQPTAVAALESGSDQGLDWLIEWAMGMDQDARDHYFHVNDGEAGSCGCRYEGEGL